MSNIDNIWSELKRKAEEATSIDILNPSKSVKQRGDVIRAQCCTESKKYKKSKLDISQSQLNKMAPKAPLCIGSSLFEGRLCCDFTTVTEFSTAFLCKGAFGAGNHALYLIFLRLSIV